MVSSCSRSAKKAHVQVCGTTPVAGWRGAGELIEVVSAPHSSRGPFHLSKDGNFQLGRGGSAWAPAVNAPMVLDLEGYLRGPDQGKTSARLLDGFASGNPPQGPDRRSTVSFSAPVGGPDHAEGNHMTSILSVWAERVEEGRCHEGLGLYWPCMPRPAAAFIFLLQRYTPECFAGNPRCCGRWRFGRVCRRPSLTPQAQSLMFGKF